MPLTYERALALGHLRTRAPKVAAKPSAIRPEGEPRAKPGGRLLGLKSDSAGAVAGRQRSRDRQAPSRPHCSRWRRTRVHAKAQPRGDRHPRLESRRPGASRVWRAAGPYGILCAALLCPRRGCEHRPATLPVSVGSGRLHEIAPMATKGSGADRPDGDRRGLIGGDCWAARRGSGIGRLLVEFASEISTFSNTRHVLVAFD